jgi:hypothetical protein
MNVSGRLVTSSPTKSPVFSCCLSSKPRVHGRLKGILEFQEKEKKQSIPFPDYFKIERGRK